MDNNNMALAVDTYEIVENLFTGESNVSDEVMTKAIESDPSAFVRAMIDFINGCEDDANSTHDKIEALQNRGFFKKMVSNNTRDIADILVQQNKVILGVLRLTQGTIYLCYSNVGLLDNMLTEIENQIQNAEPEESTELKRLMASGIKQATASARKAEDKILAVERINDKLEKKANAMIIDINALAVKNEVQDEKLTEHEKDIDAIEDKNRSQDEKLTEHEKDIDAIENKNRSQDEKLTEHEKDIDAIEDKNRSQDEKLTEHEKDIDAIENKNRSQDEKLTEHEKDIDAIEDKNRSQDEKLTEHEKDIDAIEDKNRSQDEKLTEHEKDIDAIEDKNISQDEKLTEHEKDINAIEGVNKNQDELLKSHDADIDKNEENIGINRESINSNKADIEKNSQKISSLIEEISALKLADDNARKEIAKARIIALAASGVSAAALLLSVLIAFGVI